MAMQFSKLKGNTPPEAVQSPPTASKPAEAPPTTVPALYEPGKAQMALLAVTETESGLSTFRSPYPILEVSGGNSGGAFQPRKGTAEDVGDKLPQGRKPIPCIFLGYRTSAFAWPAALNGDDEAAADKKPRPAWQVNISSADGTNHSLLTKALNNYTFKPKEAKGAFDVATGGPGHLRASFQALVYEPQYDGLIIIAGAPLYKSWTGSCASVKKLLTPQGGFITAPVMATVRTTDEKGKKPWKLHTLEFSLSVQGDMAAMMAKFKAFVVAMKEDQRSIAEMTDWLACTDNPISDETISSLKGSLAL